MSQSRITRREANLGLAAATTLFIGTGRARAADFTLKHNHNLPTDSPLHKRATEMWAVVKAETNGRVDVQITRGGEGGAEKLVDGELAFMTLAGNGLASLVPSFDVQATPYSFKNPQQVYAALDGDLGAYLHQEALAKGIYAVPRGCFENGMHQITSTSKPVRTAADLRGMKIRVPGTSFYQDYFKALGADVQIMNLTRVYDALKAGTVDAQDDPWDVVELFKFYEVQKYAERHRSFLVGLQPSREPESMAVSARRHPAGGRDQRAQIRRAPACRHRQSQRAAPPRSRTPRHDVQQRRPALVPCGAAVLLSALA